MDTASLKCPNCGGEVPDECRGLFPLHRIHPDYLCPHCETELAWEKQFPEPNVWLMRLCGLPMVGVFVHTVWNLWNGILHNEQLAGIALIAGAPYFLLMLFVFTRWHRSPWLLVVKNDPRKLFWEMEAAELKRRSRPGSKW